VYQYSFGLLNHYSQCAGAGGASRSHVGGFHHGVRGPTKYDQDSGSALSHRVVPHSHREQLWHDPLWQTSDRSFGR